MVDQKTVEKVAAAIDSVDLSHSMRLIRLVDGVSTYRLELDGAVEEFTDTDEDDAIDLCYARIRQVKQRKQAEAVIAALSPSPQSNVAGDHHELLMRLQAVQHGTDRPYAAAVCKDAGDAIKSLVEISKERDHFYNQWRACWAPLTPRSENEKQGFERVLAILKSKLSDGGGIVGPSDVQRAHNDFYRGRRVAFEECATMLRAALATTEGSTE